MGKVVILGGNARSGKTTLAHMLTKKGYTLVSFDHIRNIVEQSFDLDFDELTKEEKLRLFENVVNEYLKESETYNTNIVIDMYDYLPSDIRKLKNRKKLKVYFLAYPASSHEEIRYNIIKYAAKNDWINNVNKKAFDEIINGFEERNKILIEECSILNYPLIDTKQGLERTRVLRKLYYEILKS